MRRVYMDHASARPVDPRVIEVVSRCSAEVYGNPSSLQSQGQEAKELLEGSREKVARLINASPEEVLFTSGGTEGNNLAIKGFCRRNKEKGSRITTSSIEHISILNIAKHLGREGFNTTYLPVDSYGSVDPGSLDISKDTILVSIQYANGEVGTIQPIKEIAEIAHEGGAALHVDGVAACGNVPVDVEKEGIDMLTISSNDMYGPRGVGALYVKKGIRIAPIIQGGGQERGLRSGTEDVPNIAGFARAAEIAGAEMEGGGKHLTKLRDALIKGVLDSIPDSHLNGHPTRRLPGNANIRFSYIEGEAILLHLDTFGISASTGSACTSKTLEPSHVLTAMGIKHEEAHGSLQLTLGRLNTEEDIGYILKVLPGIVEKLRAISPLTPKGRRS